MSKATISINVRVLENFKYVRKIWKKGSRKDFYEAERDFEKIIREFLRRKIIAQNTFYQQTLKEAIREYRQIIASEQSEELRELARKDLEKVEYWVRWLKIGHRWARFLIETEVETGPPQEIKQIDVEWEDLL